MITTERNLQMDVPDCGKSEPEDNEILQLAADLLQCILSNNLNDARTLVENLSDEARRELTRLHRDVEESPALFIAVKMGNPDFVQFLVEECHADLEEHGIYYVEEDKSEHVVTPLWCAAVANKLEVVKLLVSLGADVNATSDSGSTPIRSSCYMTNVEVVRFLAENGGDLEKPNKNGGTCLINSVQNTELCRYLIDRGVNVNVQDTSGNLALHYAIREGRFETTQLLVQSGSDPYVRNEYGDDALQCASIKGFTDIVDFLFERLCPDVQRKIESYQLLGGNFVDEKQDISQGLSMWIKAIELRLLNSTISDYTLTLNPAYGLAREATSLSDLVGLSHDRDLIYMQALLLRERILGPNHKETIFGLMYRGAVYADMHDYSRCIGLWKYAFTLRHRGHRRLSHEYVFTLQALCKLFWEIYDLEIAGRNGLNFWNVIDVLEMAAEEAKDIQDLPDVTAVLSCHQERLLCLMQLILHLVHLLYKLAQDKDQTLQLKKLVHRLIRVGLRTAKGRTLFLLAIDKNTTFITDEVYSPFPNICVMELLLECGANVSDKDNKGNTALHLLREDADNTDMIKKVANLLVARGAHVDARNCKGKRAAYHLTLDWLKMDFSQHVSLKCEAAKVIRCHNIPYRGNVPQSLYDFIEMH